VALTIAGSDSGGGAGIQADLKTFTVLGVYGASVITSLTAQNTRGVEGISDVAPEFVRSQMLAVLGDLSVHAAKTGMLSSPAIVEAVARTLAEQPVALPLVVDPVMVSKSGHHLLQPEAVEAAKSCLFPLATLLTPNSWEAQMLTGRTAESEEQAMAVAEALLAMGPRAVLLKGGHRQSPGSDDLFRDQSGRSEWLRGERLNQRHTHGTGCTISAAITAYLARGWDLLEACREGKRFIQGAIRHAQPLGHGTGPVNHLWQSGGFASTQHGGKKRSTADERR